MYCIVLLTEAMMDAQLKKGLSDACVLAYLNCGDSYGYLIVKSLAPIIELSESTLYPILRRLEKNACLVTYTKEFDGRQRKYYSITPRGKAKLKDFCREWADMAKIYKFVSERAGR